MASRSPELQPILRSSARGCGRRAMCVRARQSCLSAVVMNFWHHCLRSVISMFSWLTTLSIPRKKNSSFRRQLSTGRGARRCCSSRHQRSDWGYDSQSTNQRRPCPSTRQQHTEASDRSRHIMVDQKRQRPAAPHEAMLPAFSTTWPSRHRVRVHRWTYSVFHCRLAVPHATSARARVHDLHQSTGQIIRIYIRAYRW
jgi:hypothetical protein